MAQQNWEKSYKNKEIPWRNFSPNLSKILNKANIFSGVALDLGSGTGEFSKWLSDQGFKVESIDFSEEAINIAKEVCPLCIFSNWNLENLENYPFKYKRYDIILDSKVIAFIEDKEKYLNVIHFKLKGAFVIQSFLYHKEKPLIAVNEEKLEKLLKEKFNILDKEVISLINKIWVEYILVSK